MKEQMQSFTRMTKPLVLFVLLFALGVGQMWGYSFNYPHLYFYNSGTEWTKEANKVMFFYYYHRDDGDKKQASQGFNMSKVDHTKLWYVCASENRGGSLSGFSYGFGATSNWPWEEGDNWSTRWTYMCNNYNHSGTSQTNLPYGTYLCTSSGTDNLVVTQIGNGTEVHAPLNHTQTVKKYTRGDGEGSYTAASVNSGTVSISAYQMTGSGTASNEENSDEINTAGDTEASADAAYTGEVTVTASANTGYVFMGWYSSENGGTEDKLSSSSSYTDNAPNSTKTVYARFAEKLPVGKTLYLATNAKWRENSARFAAVFCNASIQQWENCSAVAGTDDMYSVSIPDGNWGCVIFCKMKNSSDEERVNKWDNRWCQTDDMYKNGLNNCVYITGDCSNSQRWGKYAQIPAIVGGMNNWDPVANQFSGSPLRLTMDLSAGQAYQFKLASGRDDYWYGHGASNNNDLTFAGQTNAETLTQGYRNMMFLTARAGTYTFEWDATNAKLTIIYPDTLHPSMDYVYMEKYSGWNSGNFSNIHYWDDSSNPLTDGSDDPKMTAYHNFKDKSLNYYMYPMLTDYPNFKAADGLNGGTNHTDNMVATGHGGHYTYWGGSGWVWATFQVYIKLENQGADEGKKGTLGVPVAFNDTALSTRINKPIKSHYDFGGYYTAAEGGGVQIIDANGDWKQNVSDYTSSGAWIHAGDTTTLYAKWTQTAYTITPSVSPEGAGTVNTVTDAHLITPSSEITATPTHAAWIFDHWEPGEHVGIAGGKTTTDNPITVTSDMNSTITAHFKPRYELAGSLDDGSGNGGMPGWTYDGTGMFTVLSTSPTVNITCTCTLDANKKYKFEIRDRKEGKNYGAGTDGKFELIESNWAHCTNENMDMKFNTTGAAKYIFQIYEVDGNNRPTVKILWPRQVNFGWKYVNADEPNTLREGGGGTVTAYVHEGGVKTAVSNGAYMIQGATISFTAHPYNDYDFAGWWNSYSYPDNPVLTGDSVSWPVTAENANGYAKFTEKTNTLNSGSTWSDATWSKGHVPTLDEVAVIKSPVEVNVTDAKAKKVLLRQDGGNTGKIDIPAGKELVVRTTIRKTTDGSTYGATGYEDINIGSTLAEGNGALVMGTNNGTNKATVNFAVKAKKVGGHNVNQFIGTPFNDETNVLYNYYGTKIYRFMAGHDGDLGTDKEWKRVASTGEHMNGFFGYNILTNQETEPVLWMQGTLNRSAEETINGYYNGSSNTENMFANSWVAPIYIPNFENDDFTNIEKTIYIFNAGTPEDQSGHAIDAGNAETTAAGQYCVLPANSASYVGLTVIPAMQAFSVFATGASPSLKFNYTRLVYNPANGTATIVPTRAPRRTAEEDSDAPTVLRLAATGESGYVAKIVLLERTDFTDNFDDGWDGRFLAGDEAAPQLYAVTPDGNMAINSIPNIEGTLLGFKAGEADDLFTFSFDYDGEALYLYDTQLQTYTRVLTGNTYAFTTTDNTAHNRFILTRNAPGMATGTEPVNNASQVTNKMMIDNHLYIFRGGVLYDATGRMIK